MHKSFFGFLFFILFGGGLSPAVAEKSHGIAMHGDLKYQKGQPFDCVNPAAPKGGTLRFGVVGTFDSTNPFITKGTPPAGLSLFSEQYVFEGLMKRSPDEPFSLYGLLAEAVEMAPDRSSITFYLNPKAQWSDGRPVLAEDVKFSFETFREKGRPNVRLFYGRVKACEILDARTLRFTFEKDKEGGYDPEQPLLMALMRVIPKHIYQNRDFEKVSLEKVVASGPYAVKSLKPGHSIVYERREEYWGKDLAVNQGEYNFQTLSMEYYRDSKVAYEAFKAGDYDVYRKVTPSGWKEESSYPALKKGLVQQKEWTHNVQVGFKGLVMNTRRFFFQDRRVRQALVYAYDFETLNKTLFNNNYQRSLSYFPNTILAAEGVPEGEELALLTPFKNHLPTAVYEEEKTLPTTDGRGGVRHNLRQARALLQEAGWVLKKGQLIHGKTGAPFRFEILLYSHEDFKIIDGFVKNLKALGIEAFVRVVDTAHYENRRLTYDFDMIVQTWGHTLSPGNEQLHYWSTAAGQEPGSRNYPGVACPAVDALCAHLVRAKTRQELETVAHALDRVLWHGWYVIPLFYSNKIRLAHWDKFGYPEMDPCVGIRFSTWWSKCAQ